MGDGARVARFTPPGPWWYIAVCERCRWCGLSWRHKDQAVIDRNDHNNRHHGTNDEPTAIWPTPLQKVKNALSLVPEQPRTARSEPSDG